MNIRNNVQSLTGQRALVTGANTGNGAAVAESLAEAGAKVMVNYLVNNAGLQQDAALVDMSLWQWNRVIEVNLTGQFMCAGEAGKEFMRRGIRPELSVAAGKIICMCLRPKRT